MAPDPSAFDPSTFDFSVVVTCYQRTQFLPDAMASTRLAILRARDHGLRAEMVVVADLAGPPPKLLPTGETMLAGSFPKMGDAMWAGISASRGRWVVFLDDDDTMVPDKLVRLAEAVSDHPTATYLHNRWAWAWDWEMNRRKERLRKERLHRRQRARSVGIPPFVPFLRHYDVDVNASSIAVLRRVLVEDASAETIRRVVTGPDVVLAWCATASRERCGMVGVEDVLTLRRRHSANAGRLDRTTRRGDLIDQYRRMETSSPTPLGRAYAKHRSDCFEAGTWKGLLGSVRCVSPSLVIRALLASIRP